MTIKMAIKTMRVVVIDKLAGTEEITTLDTFSKNSIYQAVPLDECGMYFRKGNDGILEMVITWHNR